VAPMGIAAPLTYRDSNCAKFAAFLMKTVI
jgi:hypothetical protein